MIGGDALLLLLLDATSYVLTLLLVALGLAIVFGLMGVINMAHGELFLLGAYTLLVAERIGGGYWLGLVAAPLVVGLVGVAIEVAVVRHVYERPLDTILATWGLAIAIKQAVVIGFGPASYTVPLPITGAIEIAGAPYPLYRLFVMAVAVAALGLTLWLIQGTRLGLMIRGTIADRTMAACLGLPVRRLDRLTFGFGAALAGLAGAVMAPLMSIDPQMGLGFLLPAFLAVLIGGITGSGGGLAGTGIGAAVIGGSESTVAALVSPVIGQLVTLTLAVVVIRVAVARRSRGVRRA